MGLYEKTPPRRIKNEQHLTTVDYFVSGFKPQGTQEDYLQQKANERAERAAEEAKRKRRASL